MEEEIPQWRKRHYLINVRKALGHTQARMADILGVSPRTINRREGGEVKITDEMLMAASFLVMTAEDQGYDTYFAEEQ